MLAQLDSKKITSHKKQWHQIAANVKYLFQTYTMPILPCTHAVLIVQSKHVRADARARQPAAGADVIPAVPATWPKLASRPPAVGQAD